MIVDFLQWTAWPMQKPPSYGTFHLTFFIVGLALSILGAWLLRRTNEKQNRTVFLSVGLFLFVAELYKQLFYTFVIGGGKYQWWIFPFQLCSIPIYFCIAAAFLKPGRLRQGMYDFMLAFNLMGGFVAFFEPSGLVHEYWTLTMHAFIWHMSLIFVGLYIGFSRRAGLRISDYKGTVVTFVGLCAIAFVINLVFFKVSEGTINMFYVGPRNSPLIVFRDISEKLGWYINTPIYIAVMCLGAALFYIPFCLWNRKKSRAEQNCVAIRQ